jgi:hypothetical protein
MYYIISDGASKNVHMYYIIPDLLDFKCLIFVFLSITFLRIVRSPIDMWMHPGLFLPNRRVDASVFVSSLSGPFQIHGRILEPFNMFLLSLSLISFPFSFLQPARETRSLCRSAVGLASGGTVVGLASGGTTAGPTSARARRRRARRAGMQTDPVSRRRARRADTLSSRVDPLGELLRRVSMGTCGKLRC